MSEPKPCPFCGASASQDADTALRKMAGCRNCRGDLACKGGWTGIAFPIIDALVARDGKATVAAFAAYHGL